MNNQFTLSVASRAHTGRSSSRRLRKSNQIPAILYGKHTSPEKLAVDGPEFTKLIKTLGGRSLIIELTHGDKAEKALSFVQEVQRDPITDRFLHVDLQEVKADEKFEIRVPVHVVGEAHGVKQQGGVLEIATHQVRIRCLPKDLPEAIVLDVSELKVNETIKISQLKLMPGVEYRDNPGQPVVSCLEAEAEEAAETPAPGAAAAAPAAGAPAAPATAASGDKKAAAGAPAAAPAKAAPAKK